MMGLGTGHDAAGSGYDRYTESTDHTRNLLFPGVKSSSRAAYLFQSGDNRRSIGVSEENPDQSLFCAALLNFEILNKTFFLENLGNFELHLGSWNIHFFMSGRNRVSDSCQIITNWICHIHNSQPLYARHDCRKVLRLSFNSYQLALMTPGISPDNASFLKQILHISNFRR